MRLFIALNFTDDFKNQVKEIVSKVKENSIQGTFVNQEHMHLTVEFLGEIPSTKVEIIKNVMKELKLEPFTKAHIEIGYFKRREGNIYWLGIEKNNTLTNTQSILHKMLLEQGFELESREYKPHLTLGRKVKLKDDFNPEQLNNTVKKMENYIDRIDLMKSERINGKLVHSIVYSRHLF